VELLTTQSLSPVRGVALLGERALIGRVDKFIELDISTLLHGDGNGPMEAPVVEHRVFAAVMFECYEIGGIVMSPFAHGGVVAIDP